METFKIEDFLVIKPIESVTIFDMDKYNDIDITKDIESVNGLILDLSEVRDIDSFGISVIVRFASIAKSKSKKFGVVVKHSKIMFIFRIDRLDQFIPLYQSMDECISSLKSKN